MAAEQGLSGHGLSRWKFALRPRWLAWHAFMVAAVIGMGWLGDWQLRRAESGNALSWAYTFEWPFFAAMAVVFWAKTLRDEAHPRAEAEPEEVQLPAGAGAGAAGRGPLTGASVAPGGGAGEADADDAELAAYNAYLAKLHREVRGHGKWHGLR